MVVKISHSFQVKLPCKDIDKWTNKDLLIYFSARYEALTSRPFSIPKEAWGGMLSRIKGFRSKLNLSVSQYRDFIDAVFDKFFTQDNYVPTFGAIVSEKVFHVTAKLRHRAVCTNTEFEHLRDQLYSSDIFKRAV